MKRVFLLAAGFCALALAGCGQSLQASSASSAASIAIAGSPKGIQTVVPAYYDAQLFNINFAELSAKAEAALLAHNKSLNIIYSCDACEEEGFHFTQVIDAIQGDGFNPLWQEVQIVFPAGVTPVQFTSDDQILDAAASGQITLQPTDEVYRCSVLGRKH